MPSLRSAASRFSLNEQFAASRKEYEFGFDDAASSTFAPSIVEEGSDADSTLEIDDLGFLDGSRVSAENGALSAVLLKSAE